MQGLGALSAGDFQKRPDINAISGGFPIENPESTTSDVSLKRPKTKHIIG
jgi:hypothetical protein